MKTTVVGGVSRSCAAGMARPSAAPRRAAIRMPLLAVVAALLVTAASAQRAQSDGITVEGMALNGTRRQYSCPARFVRMGNSCYFMSTHMATWHHAHFKCRSKGAVLAAFEQRNENRIMRKYLQREELAPLSRWIGGIYQWQQRFWMWGSTGHAVAYKGFPRRMVNRDWAWHCISLDPTADYQWRPASCLEAKHYICETPLRHRNFRTVNRTIAQQGRGAGSKQRKGPRRRPSPADEDNAIDKDRSSHFRRVGDPSALSGPRWPPQRTSASTPRGPPRWDRPRATPPPGDGTVHRRPSGPHNRWPGPGGYQPPPPPASGQGRPAAGQGAVAGRTRYQARHQVGYSAYAAPPSPRRVQQERATPATAATAFVGTPSAPSMRDARDELLRRLSEASVKPLQPEQPLGAISEDNDFPNDV